jgi:TonB family protein
MRKRRPMRFILLKVTTVALFLLMLSAALTTSAAAATDQAPSDMGTVPASSVGLQLQLGAILNAEKHGGSKAVDDLVDHLRVPENTSWFDNTFGSEIGGRLSAAYTSSWREYRDNVRNMYRENANRKDTKIFVKEFSDSSSSAADAFIRSILKSAKAPVVLYTASSGKKSGMDSLPGIYIFERGTFRVINWRTFYELPNMKPVRIRVGEQIAASQLVYHVDPNPPSDPLQKQVQGTVIVHVVIDRDGVVTKFEPVNGPSELFGSALDAVRQWRYKPVILNGDPVEVDTTVKVAF